MVGLASVYLYVYTYSCLRYQLAEGKAINDLWSLAHYPKLGQCIFRALQQAPLTGTKTGHLLHILELFPIINIVLWV